MEIAEGLNPPLEKGTAPVQDHDHILRKGNVTPNIINWSKVGPDDFGEFFQP